MANLEEVFPSLKKEQEEENRRQREGYLYHDTIRYDVGKCPICEKCVSSFCQCNIGSVSCENGHEWYVKGNRIYDGNGH